MIVLWGHNGSYVCSFCTSCRLNKKNYTVIQANFDHLVYFLLILGISLKSVIFLELHMFREWNIILPLVINACYKVILKILRGCHVGWSFFCAYSLLSTCFFVSIAFSHFMVFMIMDFIYCLKSSFSSIFIDCLGFFVVSGAAHISETSWSPTWQVPRRTCSDIAGCFILLFSHSISGYCIYIWWHFIKVGSIFGICWDQHSCHLSQLISESQ